MHFLYFNCNIYIWNFKKTRIGLCAILIMGYGDGLAAVIGRNVKSKPYKIGNTTKTIAGSFTMFIYIIFNYCNIFSNC